MQFCPRFHQSSLYTRDFAGDKVYRVNAEHACMLLVVGMEVGRVVTDTGLHEHSDHDAEEDGDDGHL